MLRLKLLEREGMEGIHAAALAKEILQRHEAEPLPEDVRRELDTIIKEAERGLIKQAS